ncbi:MAG: ABC transporter substrate-binding protein [Oscillospiraceae bacterium]|nr:ABC transporter substrate-binding protein [Oscillospiraceae bacterium]MBQ4564973.1 ABC transporter substrate-binding protein [Oscillospiraceae bacterium]
MKMKKIIAMLLVLCMVACLFAGCSKEEDKGSVYFLNFKPEADEAWQELATLYTEKTGVEVKVVTAASGTYSDTLTAEMTKEDMPTLFQCGNLAGLETWKDYCLALDGTDFLNEMTTSDFNLKGEDGKTYAAGYCYEAFGIIVNNDLLAKAGYSVADIKDFASLKTIVEDITARKDELGFSAFTSAGLDSSSSWRFSGHLANMPLYYEGVNADSATITGEALDCYKNIWDLYINNATVAPTELAAATGDQSKAEFVNGEAVFHQQGTWEYAGLTEAGVTNMTMIPIYCGAENEADAGLCCGTENCWAVNAKASEADQKATLEFLKWVVTSDEGTKMMAEQFGPIPFKAAKESSNVFFNDANALMAEGKYTVTWAFNYTPNVDAWRQGVVDALIAYSAGTGDWAAVETAFVDGWATQWAAQNG